MWGKSSRRLCSVHSSVCAYVCMFVCACVLGLSESKEWAFTHLQVGLQSLRSLEHWCILHTCDSVTSFSPAEQRRERARAK